jgi:hypothetical protein
VISSFRSLHQNNVFVSGFYQADRQRHSDRTDDTRTERGDNQKGVFMKTAAVIAIAVAALSGSLVAQENKPVPKDSMRVFVPGCTKGLIFTAGPRTEDQTGRSDIPEGMHLRMNGPKEMMAEIKAHEGSTVEITGLIKRGQYAPDGIDVGHGVRIGPGPSPTGSNLQPNFNQIVIDVEGWRPVAGSCRR